MAETKSKSRSKKGTDHSSNEANSNANTASNVATSKENKTMSENTPSVVEFSEDISTAEAPVPLPAGDYLAEIRGAERKIGSTSGKPYAAVTFFIPPEQYPADYTEGEPDGTTLSFNRTSLQDTPASRFRVKRFCEAIGAPMKGNSIDLNDWVGRTATVTVTHGEFEGLPKAEISKVTAA